MHALNIGVQRAQYGSVLKMVKPSLNEIYFGGPDMKPGQLRDLLAERIGAVPAGGAIDWVTYYFRDRRLAEELLRARRRGVKVSVTLEGSPRTSHANDAVISMLAGPEGLNNGFRTLSLPGLPNFSGRPWKPHLHEKLYCFSHPEPVAFIGSFNPSGDIPEDHPEIISEIGDQDRGHNVLVALYDPLLVKCLVDHARQIHLSTGSLFHRFSGLANKVCRSEDTEIHFWPRSSPHPVKNHLSRVAPGARIRLAASHLKGRSMARILIGMARKGARLEVLAEATTRRVPAEIERMLKNAGMTFHRVKHDEGLPMHNKFILVEKNALRAVIFGSLNWTTRSYWLNYEIGIISSNNEIYSAFDERWKILQSQAA